MIRITPILIKEVNKTGEPEKREENLNKVFIEMRKILLIITALMLIVGITDAQTYQFANGFHDNGMVKEIKYHKKTRDGIELVKGETYYSSGQKESEGTYKDGKFLGETFWDEDGYELVL